MGKYKVIEGRDAKYYFQLRLKNHKKCMKNIKPLVDNHKPEHHVNRPGSPRTSQDEAERIAHSNLKLANKIFDIMEGPGIITGILKQSEAEAALHPGTLNFKRRVKEATRIHNQNINLASRLDNVKPYYSKLFNINKTRATTASRTSPSKSPSAAQDARGGVAGGGVNAHGVPGLMLPRNLHGDGGGIDTTRTDVSTKKKLNMNFGASRKMKSVSARGAESGSGATMQGSGANSAGGSNKKTALQEDGTSAASSKQNNVLLEYSKIQSGRVLDIAVIKEPFQGRYAVVGIDIDNGQRYELRLTSDNVASVLDGDILVTSLDHVEVWMALLNKITLKPVETFSRLAVPAATSTTTQQQKKQGQLRPQAQIQTQAQAQVQSQQLQQDSTTFPPGDDGDSQNLVFDDLHIADDENGNDNKASGAGIQLEPEAPDVARPTTRPGGRGSRSQARQQQKKPHETSTDVYDAPGAAGNEAAQANTTIDSTTTAPPAEDETAAAAKIQSIFRGNKARATVQQSTSKPAVACAISNKQVDASATAVPAKPAPPTDPKSRATGPQRPAKKAVSNKPSK